MKKIFILLVALFLSSCVMVMYSRDEKIENKNNVRELASKDDSVLGPFINYDYYTKKNIIKTFGEPSKCYQDEDMEFFEYKATSKQPKSIFLAFILPFESNIGDDIYKYSFEFQKEKLINVSYQDLKNKTMVFGLMYPPIGSKEKNLGLTPFYNSECSKEHNRVFIMFPHLKNDEVTKQELCYKDKLFGVNSDNPIYVDEHLYSKGYTKALVMRSIFYNKDIVKFKRKDIEKHIEKSMLKGNGDIMIDITIKTEDYKNQEIDCKLFITTAKDYNAPNKGKNPYLLIDNIGALCFTKIPDMFLMILNSNRYPENMNINTYEELKNVLATIKVK